MSLQIIYGLGGSGKTEHLLKLAEKHKTNQEKNVFFIVPEQYSYETEKNLAKRLGVVSPKTVEVLSFKRLFFYVCNHLGGALLPRLTDTGKEILVAKAARKCIKELKVLGKTAKYNGFSDILVTLFSEFKRYNTTPERLEEITGKIEEDFLRFKMQDISLLYKTYEEEITGAFTDPEDELTLLADILKEHPDFFANSVIYIDAFEGFTPQEMNVIAQLLRSSDEVKITLCTNTLTEVKGKRSIFSMQIKTAAALDELAEKYNIAAEKPVYLAEAFVHDKSPSMKHLEKSLREGTYGEFKEIPDIEIMFALNLTRELEQIAEKIITLVRDNGYRYKDFSVVARNAEDYKSVARSVFERFGIPLYENSKTSLSEETPAYALITALNVIIRKWDYNTLFSYLKTGYSSVSDSECDFIENYIILTGIRGSSWTNQKPWKYCPNGYTEAMLERIEEIRNKIVQPFKELEEKLEKATTARDYIKAVVEFMQTQRFFRRVKKTGEFYRDINADTAKKYEQVYSMIIASLEDIDAVTGEEEPLLTEEFAAMLQAAFEARTVGIIPTSADSVTFADAERSRAAKCKIMFVVGVNDGVFPAVFMNEGVIKDDERQALESLGLKMAPDTFARTYDEDFVVYATLLHPSERLYLSYPMADNAGGSLSPSGLIKKMKNLFPLIPETENVTDDPEPIDMITTPESALGHLAVEMSRKREGAKLDPVWDEVANQLENNREFLEKYQMVKKTFGFENGSKKISEENLKKLYGEKIYTSVSKLETFKKCPFMYFAKYILKAEPRKSTELRSVDTGTIMHAVIEQISIRVRDTFGSWSNVTNDWLEKNVEEISELEAEKLKSTMEVVEPRQLWALIRLKNAVKMSAFAVAKQLQSGEFIPMGYEISFGDDGQYKCIEFTVNGKKVKLGGKIDRGDIYTDPNGKKYIRIIDYKSGNREFRIENLYHGMNLQLAVYLDSLTKQEGAKCAGMLYFRLFDPIASVEADISTDDAAKAVEKERRSAGLLIADREIVTKMDSSLEKGEPSYLPVKLKKDGDFDAYSKVATYAQFEAMNKYVRKIVKQMSKEMLCGTTSISPYKMGSETPCALCDYKKVCHFDACFGNKYNHLEKIKSEEAWEKIEKEGK